MNIQERAIERLRKDCENIPGMTKEELDVETDKLIEDAQATIKAFTPSGYIDLDALTFRCNHLSFSKVFFRNEIISCDTCKRKFKIQEVV